MKIKKILQSAKQAAATLALTSHNQRRSALLAIAKNLKLHSKNILQANQRDLAVFPQDNPQYDRLKLTDERINGMAEELISLTKMPDPLGKIYDRRKSGQLFICKKTVPLGVIGIIYEARPNVTTDVSGICLKSGNAVILKGGREAKNSYAELIKIIRQSLTKVGLDANAVQMLDPLDRQLVTELITANHFVDLVIPRGGKNLIDFVRDNATVPVIETGAGVCHTFVDKTAKLAAAAQVVFNAKTQRPSVCNALDTLLVHEKIAKKFLPLAAKLLVEKKVEIFSDRQSFAILNKCYPKNLLRHAQESDFGREFLSQKMSVKIVPDVKAAIKHIQKYSSRHSEAILTEDKKNAAVFNDQVDAAAIYVNASTRFSDGAVFGLGSEIGTSTQKMHARGPMGAAELTTYKWLVTGKYSSR